MSEIKVGDDLLVVEYPHVLTNEQREFARAAYQAGIKGRTVVILEGGAKLARDYSEQLGRIEAKLDRLIEWLADEGEQEEQEASITTMDGEVIRLSGESMTL